MTGGNISIHGLCRSSANGAVDSLLGGLPEFLVAAGCRVEISENIISVAASSRLRAASFASAPYPGIATDIQPLLMAALTVAEGTSVVTETVFENRFGHVAEYRRLGADIEVDGRTAIVNGKSKLSGAPVEVADIRAGAGLVLLGLVAQGVTEIQDIYHLDRGYELLVEKFSALGARLSRIPLHEQRELVVGC